MSDFFRKRKTKKSDRVIDLVEDESTSTASTSTATQEQPPPKKKYAKHTNTNGFNQNNINEHVNRFMARQPKGNWRNNQNSCRIAFTYVIQKWGLVDDDRSVDVYHFAPWGMREAVAKRLTAPQVKANLSVIPLEVQEKFSINKDNLNKITLEVTNTGYNAPQPFVRFYCTDCQKTFLPKLLNNSRYGNFESVEALVSNWDDAKIPDDLMENAGCFICALDERVHMGPNKNCFFKDPCEHRKSYHPELWYQDAVACSTKQLQRSNLIQKLLATDKAALPTLVVTKPPAAQAESSSSSAVPQQTILTSKFNKKTKYQFIDNSFQKKLAVNEKCVSNLQKVAMGFCLSIVHVGINKCLSEAATIELYETSYRGIYDHCAVQEDAYKEMYGATPNKTTIAAPQQVSLNKDNIMKFETVILKAYQKDEESKYAKIKKSRFWGIMHDGIQKFCIEYNGMLLQSYDPDSFDPLLVPFRLMKMKGGVNAHDTVYSLMTAFAEFLEIKDNAFESIRTFIGFENVINADIPVYFKLSVVLRVGDGEIHLSMSGRLPIANCGDGVSVNLKAARVLCELYGFLCPDFRCSSHTVDGCWKRIARSETMCVEEVKSVYENLKPVVKHFKLSSKSKENLDASMDALEMGHGVHLMTWCATRMAHFVVACVKFDELLVPVYNTMFTMQIKAEERNKLFQADNIFTIKVVADLHGIMHNKLQRSVDKDDYLVSETYNLTRETANLVRNLETPRPDKFVESLHLDGNGNLMFTEVLNGNEHTLRLTNTHKSNRRQTEDERLESIKEKLKKIKAEVLTNIHENLNDQVSDDSYYLPWSGLDLSDKNCSVEERITKLKPLLDTLCEPRVHQVQKYLDVKETQVGPYTWNGHSIFLHYPAVLDCTSDDLADEIKRAWASIGRLYQRAHQETRGKPNQRQVWKNFLLSPDSGIMYPNVCSLIMILLATPANTSPLERSYSPLEMICTPRRNHIKPEHLELLYLLKSLNLPVKNSAEYADAVELLST